MPQGEYQHSLNQKRIFESDLQEIDFESYRSKKAFQEQILILIIYLAFCKYSNNIREEEKVCHH